jgi:hypothetical protein
MPDDGPQSADDGVVKVSKLPAPAAPHPAGAGCLTAARRVQMMELSKVVSSRVPARCHPIPCRMPDCGSQSANDGVVEEASELPRALPPHTRPEPNAGRWPAECKLAVRVLDSLEGPPGPGWPGPAWAAGGELEGIAHSSSLRSAGYAGELAGIAGAVGGGITNCSDTLASTGAGTSIGTGTVGDIPNCSDCVTGNSVAAAGIDATADLSGAAVALPLPFVVVTGNAAVVLPLPSVIVTGCTAVALPLPCGTMVALPLPCVIFNGSKNVSLHCERSSYGWLMKKQILDNFFLTYQRCLSQW